jgi:predicted nucleotide-binding protein
VVGEEGRVPDERPNQIDRSFQRSLLLWMRDKYPSMAYEVPKSLDGNDPRFYFNLFYLQEHGLCETLTQESLDGKISWGGAKITAKGLDFLESDGVIDKKATPAGATMTTPTDGEWMSAYEARQFLQPHADAASAICRRAHAGLVKARAKWFIGFDEQQTDVEVPRQFWWAEGGDALEQNWVSGDFETWIKTIVDRGRREGRHQAFGVTFRRQDIEQMRPAITANPTVAPLMARRPAARTVFIGHGGQSSEWLKLEKFLRHRLGLSPIEFNSTSAAGVATTERLMEMLARADFAFLILTGEDEQGTGEFHPRLNVVHEAGLFQGKLGFKKAIILLEGGCEKFSNVHGLSHIQFPKGKIDAAFEDVRGVLEREGLI